MTVIVLLNAAAGTTPPEQAEEDARQVRAAFAAAGAEADVRRVDGTHLSQAASDAVRAGAGVVVAAGGDGTQSAVAAGLAGTSAVMGVLPMGTLNHFAKDLGLPLDVEAAARVIVTGRPRMIDVAEVNGRVFINNSSIGLYPRVVRHRDEMRERLGRGKWLAMLLAVIAIFRRFALVRLRMSVNGETWLRATPFVFVGNNQYQIEGMDLGSRTSLEGGQLCIYFANRTGRLGMFRLAFRALIGRLRQDKDFNALCATEVWIDTRRPKMSVALDGEVRRFAPPLHYQIRPKALRVILPADGR